ncbi:hypothetical protein QFZ80_000840 [Paenibacillus sp. V4I7]|nr:hypothetical protein [Paenibacillus sp. V4I7]MDQ0916841.1 hypothetical protein [Paenibacillus sp. V4I5]
MKGKRPRWWVFFCLFVYVMCLKIPLGYRIIAETDCWTVWFNEVEVAQLMTVCRPYRWRLSKYMLHIEERLLMDERNHFFIAKSSLHS